MAGVLTLEKSQVGHLPEVPLQIRGLKGTGLLTGLKIAQNGSVVPAAIQEQDEMAHDFILELHR